MKKLYKFFWDCGRMGEVEGLFIADDKEVKEAIGEHVSFGEILGKHSDVYGTLDDGDLTMLEVPESVLDILEDAIGSKTISGYNPLSYIRFMCSKCENTYEEYEVDWSFDSEGNRICSECLEEDEE